MMVVIKCPKCNSDGQLSLLQSNYEGPYKCWKCREMLTIQIENNVLKSCEPMSQEDAKKELEREALRTRFGRGG